MILYNMPFNVEKWMASPSVRDMTKQEQAAYLLLLVECWSRDGYLDSKTIDTIKNSGGCQWKKAIDSVVFKMFLQEKPDRFDSVSDSFSNRFYNETQLKLFENLVKTEQKRSKIGQLSAQKRWDTHRLPNGSPISLLTNNQYPITNNQLKEEANASKKNDCLLNLEDTTDSKPKKPKFIPPTLEEVNQFAKYYCEEKKIHNDRDEPQSFLDYWNERNWIDKTKTAVTDWKARYRTWMRNKTKIGQGFTPTNRQSDFINILKPTADQAAMVRRLSEKARDDEEIKP